MVADDDVTQEEIDLAKTALETAKAGLAKKPQEESGCGSVVGGTFATVGIALGVGTLLKRKKEDDQ